MNDTSPYTELGITICGWAGEGKTTLAQNLQADLILRSIMSSGNFVREFVAKNGMTMDEYERLAEEDPRYDRAVDDRTREFGLVEKSFVFEGRLGWHCILGSFKVLLTCDDNVRFGRLSERLKKPVDVVREETRDREERMRRRFKKWYGIDRLDDRSRFDVTVDTSEKSPAAVAEEVVAAVCRLRSLVLV